jgi:hypothetical protein
VRTFWHTNWRLVVILTTLTLTMKKKGKQNNENIYQHAKRWTFIRVEL